MSLRDYERIDRLETLGSFDPSNLDGSLDEAITMLQGYKERAADNGWYKVHIDVDWYYDDCNIYIKAWRPETDAEYESRWAAHKAHLDKKAARQKKAAEAAARKLAKTEAEQRALYEELKAKFG